MDLANAILFSIPAYKPLGIQVASSAGVAQGTLETRRFPDGERYLRLLSQVRGRDVVVVGGTPTDGTLLDVFDLCCGAVKEGCHSLTLLIPFFGYATMERAVKSGEVVTAKARARIISAIPTAPGGNRVALLDLHADGITYYFEGALVPEHLYAKPVVLEAIKELGGTGCVVGSVDAGRAKWVESLANDLGVAASFILKRRLSDRQTEVVAMSAAVSGKMVVIYDDMIRTGGSLISAARAYKDAGATSLAAVATHGVFPEDALGRLQDSGLFSALVCTDSHPNALELAASGQDFLKVKSVAPILAQHLKSLAHPAVLG